MNYELYNVLHSFVFFYYPVPVKTTGFKHETMRKMMIF
jgi:hypothetical protein